NALLKGDYEFYKPGDEPLVLPVYQVDGTIKQSPLIHVRVLALLYGMHRHATDDNDRYLTMSSLISYFGTMSTSEVAIQRSVEFLLAGGLVEPYDLSKKDYSDDQKIAISQSGLSHLDMAVYNPVFFEQMALTTRIPDSEAAARIRGAYHSKKAFNARLEEVRRAFCEYLLDEDARHCSVPVTPEYRLQVDLAAELRNRWIGAAASSTEMLKLPEKAAEGVRGTVERFDQTRGFGFVDIPSLRDTAFLHASVLERDGLEEVHDGDDIICDVSRNEKGLTISRVLEVSKSEGPVLSATVVKLFDERGYGFVHVEETGVDAFFHYHLLSASQKRDLFEGKELSVDVVTDKQGRSQVRKIKG
ncbi:MAG TPA: cold shock domain-containing protein, partial [Allosphingosinicella sp.]